MVADWIAEEIKAFGRLLGLTAFALNERGLAAVLFENGLKLRLEYASGFLWVQVLAPMAPDEAMFVRLLEEAHPGRNLPLSGSPLPCVRVACLEQSGEALLAMKLKEDEIESPRIDAAFRGLFERALRLGRVS